jgi:aldose sugar dehydrogenase
MKSYTCLALPLLLVILLASFNLHAVEVKQSNQSKPTYKTETIITGINVPWGMVQLPDQNFLITERSGALYWVDGKQNKKQLISGLPKIDDSGQGGLLDIALSPNYAADGWVYFSYASSEGEGWGSNTAIMRAKLNDFALIEKQLLYKANPNSIRGQHFGSRITFDRAGYLYFSIGDRGNRDENPQDITRDGGKIYRLNANGTIPKDNPFIKMSDPKSKQYKTAIYSYGHRNPQGMAMHPETGDIWIHEHGPKGGDEINIISKGKNYGWPLVSYGVNYSGTKFTDLTEQTGMQSPIWHWTPSIAPSGMTFVTSDTYPDWQGQLLVGSLKFGYLMLCKLDGNKVISEKVLFDGIGRVRNVVQLNDGYIYVATENNKIVRIVAED